MLRGWVKWKGGKKVDHAMVATASGRKPPTRIELGDTDESLWETDDCGKPKDPWQYTFYLPLVAVDDGEIYTLAGSDSWGWREALGKLTRNYTSHWRRAPNELPVITLGVGGYRSKKGFGWIKTPQLNGAGWKPVRHFNEAMALAGYSVTDTETDTEPVPEPDAKPKAENSDLDDIPF
jgi:hypothetical protein